MNEKVGEAGTVVNNRLLLIYCFLSSLVYLVDKQLRTPRRTQKPKTLNTPEDSTYYTLIHVSPAQVCAFKTLNSIL